ncbi:MAG: hypothetical protein GF419_03585 [Ignavibacteriales bacterium]|nr:hypothetical protein [Ignavibacteriales bacterium]
MTDRIFHVISNTHWDREWRYPFQRNRRQLVAMIDRVLDILAENPDYRAFHLDSQSVVVEDYLEARPNRRDEFDRRVRERRLLVGPWYILPEEFQVGGENLVRNLLLGHRVCREHGRVSKIGYSPFSWGQISQLPQIYREFGIDFVMFYRGVNSLDSPKAEFLWRGADGELTLASRFSTMPRYNFYFYIYRHVAHGEDFGDVERAWTRGGAPFRFADARQGDEDYGLLAPNDEYHEDRVEPQARKIVEDQADDFTTPHVLWMEGHDSSGPSDLTPRIISDIREKTGLNVVHGDLEEYARLVSESADRDRLPVVEGERRSAQYDNRSGNLYGYTTSARMPLKQTNFDAERVLQFYAEPFEIFSGLLGADIDNRLLDLAWKLVVQNSAHDSIGGCSLDSVHEDGVFRYKQAVEICEGAFETAAQEICKRLDARRLLRDGEDASRAIFFAAINPNAFRRDETIEATIDVPRAQDEGSLELRDENGKLVETQMLRAENADPVLENLLNRPQFYAMRRYRVAAKLENLPAFGARLYRVDPAKPSSDKRKSVAAKRNGSTTLENERLMVVVRANGTFDVTDKATGATYERLGVIQSEGEAGTAWLHKPIGPIRSTRRTKPTFVVETNGALTATVRVDNRIRVPLNLEERRRKGGKQVAIDVTTRLTLRAGAKRLDLSIDVENRAESHRLRVLFPTGVAAEHSHGEGQFDVVARPIERIDASGWVEQPMYDYPLHHFVDLSDGERGAAIIVDGLKEYEAFDDDERTVAITLLRGFENVVAPSSTRNYADEKGSQCLGSRSFRMAFYPHRGDWREGEAYAEALAHNNPIRAAQLGTTSGEIQTPVSFLDLQPRDFVFSALKRPENGEPNAYVLRAYNPTNERVVGRATFRFPIESAEETTIEEIAKRPASVENKRELVIDAPPKKIKTYLIRFKRA